MHIAYMHRDAAITIRIPQELKRALVARARAERRSVSAQVTTYLEQGVRAEVDPTRGQPGRFLGRFEGGPIPTEADFREVRARLWGSLGKGRKRAGA